MRGTLHALSPAVLSTTMGDCPHLTDVETEAQRAVPLPQKTDHQCRSSSHIRGTRKTLRREVAEPASVTLSPVRTECQLSSVAYHLSPPATFPLALAPIFLWLLFLSTWQCITIPHLHLSTYTRHSISELLLMLFL